MIEFRSYDQTPSTASKKDDGLDCLSMIIYKHGRYLQGGGISWKGKRMFVKRK